MIRLLVTRGFGNGTFNGTVSDIVTRGYETTLNGLTSVSSDINLRWDALSSISKDSSLTWNLLNSVSVDSGYQWGINTSSTSDLSIDWNVLNTVSKDAAIIWSIEQGIESDLSLRWSIQSETQFPDIDGIVTVYSNTPLFTLQSATPKITVQ